MTTSKGYLFRRYIWSAVLATMLTALGSCRDDSIISNADFTVSGMDVTVTIAVDFPIMDVQTRTPLPDPDLNDVQSLWVATFNANTGKMTTDGWQNTDVTPNTDDTHVFHPVSINTKSGPSYIVAVANVNNNYGVKKDDDQTATPRLLSELLRDVQDWNDFLNIAVQTPDNQTLVNAPNTPLAMAGAYTNAEKTPDNHTILSVPLSQWQTENFRPYTIPATEDGIYTFPDGAIHMRRLVSHVNFNLTPGPGIKITPHSYTVVNAPKYSWLYERAGERTELTGTQAIANLGANFGDNSTKDNSNTDYYAEPIAFPSYAISQEGTTGKYTFDFWQGENKHTSMNTIDDSDKTAPGIKTAYNQRDKQSATQLFTTLTGESWTPNNMASYVLINCTVDYDNRIDVNDKGEIVKPDETTKLVDRTGEATYLIHLGYMGGNPNDFNCYRNTEYTYNVTINGVNDIRVEAWNESETPGVEGIVSDVENEARTHDAHYEQFNIYLTDDELAAYNPDNGSGFGFILTTYDNLASGNTVKTYSEDDFLNRSFDDLPTADKRYVDWVELKPTTDEDVFAEYTPRGAEGSTTFNLVDASKGLATISQSGYYTVFIKEYTYDSADDNPANETVLYNGRPLWHSYVGASPRRYYIRVTKAVSDDGKSVYARSKYAGVQNSIATYYALDAQTTSTENGKTANSAVGVEHVNESYGLNLRYTYKVEKDRTNGRYNCWTFTGYGYNNGWTEHTRNKTNGWNYYLDLSAPQKIGAFSGNGNTVQTMPLPKIRNLADYQNEASTDDNKYAYSPQSGSSPDDYIEAISACLNRNRDNDGNGIIDASEMRWYVPAIGKYLRLLIGQDALQPNQLVNYKTMPRRPADLTDNSFWGEYLYYSSDDYILWSMEGFSTSPWKDTRCTPPWQVRCIRNLGTNLSVNIQANDQTIPAYKYDSSTRIVTMDYYPSIALRTTAYSGNGTEAGQMPVHTINEEYNSIYRYGFQVSEAMNGTMSATNTIVYNWLNNYCSAWDWENLRDYINTNPTDHRNPCTQLNTGETTGWRLPNIKELAIMKNLGIITDANAQVLSCSMGMIASNGQIVTPTTAPTTNNSTRAADGSNNNRHSYMSTAADGRITQSWPTNNTYNIRCVRDYTGGR